jgi:hypothetical protein
MANEEDFSDDAICVATSSEKPFSRRFLETVSERQTSWQRDESGINN